MKLLIQYFKEARAELAKVIWPNRRQTVQLTIVVVAFSIITAAFIGGLDYIFSIGLQKLILKG